MIRNQLSVGFIDAVHKRLPESALQWSTWYRRWGPLRPEQIAYIDMRRDTYGRCLSDPAYRRDSRDGVIARVIWNHRLPFEFHEYIETYWQSAAGDEKRFFQGLILAAGHYIHREYGRAAPADRLARRARELLTGNRENQWLGTTVDPLIAALGSLDPMPRI